MFYKNALSDLEKARATREYGLDMQSHPNWFDASSIPWISYDSLNIELPDGFTISRVFTLIEEEIARLTGEKAS